MKRRMFLGLAMVCGLAFAATGVAQDSGQWRAANEAAKSTTGDVYFSGQKVSINFSAFIIAEIRALKPEEATGVFDVDPGAVGSGHLYRTMIPASKRFVRKNSLCGSEDTQWMVSYSDGRSLHLAFFSGSDMPVLTAEGLATATDLCGTLLYSR
jgi:hypothetical protein